MSHAAASARLETSSRSKYSRTFSCFAIDVSRRLRRLTKKSGVDNRKSDAAAAAVTVLKLEVL